MDVDTIWLGDRFDDMEARRCKAHRISNRDSIARFVDGDSCDAR